MSDIFIPICWLFGIVSSMSKENVVIVKEKDTMNKVVWSMPYVSFCYKCQSICFVLSQVSNLTCGEEVPTKNGKVYELCHYGVRGSPTVPS